MAESIVELELLILNKLCYAVDFESVFMHDYFRVAERNTVDLAILEFLGENRTFFDAN